MEVIFSILVMAAMAAYWLFLMIPGMRKARERGVLPENGSLVWWGSPIGLLILREMRNQADAREARGEDDPTPKSPDLN